MSTDKNNEIAELALILSADARAKIHRAAAEMAFVKEFTREGIEKRAKADARKAFRAEFAAEIAAGEEYAASLAAKYRAKLTE